MMTLCTTYLGTSSFQAVLVKFIGPPTIASVRWEEVPDACVNWWCAGRDDMMSTICTCLSVHEAVVRSRLFEVGMLQTSRHKCHCHKVQSE